MKIKLILGLLFLVLFIVGCSKTPTGKVVQEEDELGIPKELLEKIKEKNENTIQKELVSTDSEDYEIYIIKNDYEIKQLDAYKDYIVLVDERNDNEDIFLRNLETGEVKQITSYEGHDCSPHIWEDKIVFARQHVYYKNKFENAKSCFETHGNTYPTDIYTYDLKTDEIKDLTCYNLTSKIVDFKKNKVIIHIPDVDRFYLIDTNKFETCFYKKVQNPVHPLGIDWVSTPERIILCVYAYSYNPSGGEIWMYPCMGSYSISDNFIIGRGKTELPLEINKDIILYDYSYENLNEDNLKDAIKYPKLDFTDLVGNYAVYVSFDKDGNLYKNYYNLEDKSPEYKELDDINILNKLEHLYIKDVHECFERNYYEQCIKERKSLAIYNPKTDKITVIHGAKRKFSGGLYGDWKVIEKADEEIIDDNTLNRVAITDNRIFWLKNNQNCVKLGDKDHCTTSSDIYVLELK